MKCYFHMKQISSMDLNGNIVTHNYPIESVEKREYCCKAMDLFSYDIGMHLKKKMEISTEFGSIELNYCPNCGRKVELIEEKEPFITEKER